MIYLIFTHAGFEEAKDLILKDKATLWINNDVLSATQINDLKMASIVIHTLTNTIDPSNEKLVLATIELIEKNEPDADLLVEYL